MRGFLLSMGFVSMMMGASASAAQGGEHGNGGDFLRFVFEEGRTYGINLVRSIRSCSIPSEVPGPVRNWILINQQEFGIDMQRSAFQWSIDTKQPCAFTATTRNAQIELSYEACRPTIADKEAAARVLFHETTHHFGITDESFADWVSYAIYASRTGNGCSGGGNDDIFSSNYCPTAPMSAGEATGLLGGSTKVALGNFEISLRRRTCRTVGGCSEWITTNPSFDFLGFQNETKWIRTSDGDRQIPAVFETSPARGTFGISLKNDHPYLTFNSTEARLAAPEGGASNRVNHYDYLLDFIAEIAGQSITETLYARCLRFGWTGDRPGDDRDMGNCAFPHQPTELMLGHSSTPAFSGRLTSNCLWLYKSSRADGVQDENGNTYSLEMEGVIHGKF